MPSTPATLAVGTATGLANGAFGMGGPPVILFYFASFPLECNALEGWLRLTPAAIFLAGRPECDERHIRHGTGQASVELINNTNQEGPLP